MNQCTTTGGAPAMTDNSTNTGNSCNGTGSGYLACPGMMGETGNPALIKEVTAAGNGSASSRCSGQMPGRRTPRARR
ncbi:hypothetical protein [Streptomyces sp. NPDC058297]|uniref:hypothetical protein n=1 Tax=unclassified Streptomyces TaxID=2593676 RepID=UPI0036E01037